MIQLIDSFGAVLDPTVLFAIAMGTIAGIVAGALPGLTASLAIAILLPFTFALDPLVALSAMAGIFSGAMYGGAIPAILMRIPGTPAGVATTFDGFPLAQQGKARLALHTALFASTVGAICSSLSVMLLSPLLVSVALVFGPAEYFWVAVFGLTSVALLLEGQPIKGIISSLLGVGVGIIGLDPIRGIERLTFDIPQLASGVDLIVLMTGLYAVPPSLALLAPRNDLTDSRPEISGERLTLKRAIALFPSCVRSSIIGIIIGIMPGAGGSLAAFIGYGEERRAARDSSKFGRGELRGVAAAECANNAENTSAMIPTLALGVPGGSVAAMVMGGLLIQGLTPGPTLFLNDPDVAYGFMWAMLLAAPMMFVFGLLGASAFVQVLRLPRGLLGSMILVLTTVGVYTARTSMTDVWLMYSCGLAGYFLARWGFPLAPIILGVILGPIAESNFRRAILISQGNIDIFFASAAALILIALTVLAILVPLYRSFRDARKPTETIG